MAARLARALRPGDRVVLEGPLGAGKTTFARALLEALGVSQPPEGSPTFAIAHEYRAPIGRVVHLDLYRLKDESELEEAGVPGYLWDEQAIAIVEWLSTAPDLERAVTETAQPGAANWLIDLAFAEGVDERRSVTVRRLSKAAPR